MAVVIRNENFQYHDTFWLEEGEEGEVTGACEYRVLTLLIAESGNS